MTDHSRPLAIAILGLPDRASDFQQRTARIAVALAANVEGYALLEIFQLPGTTRGDEPVYNAVETLAVRMEVAAVILSGIVDDRRVDAMAERVRLTVVKLEGWRPP